MVVSRWGGVSCAGMRVAGECAVSKKRRNRGTVTGMHRLEHVCVCGVIHNKPKRTTEGAVGCVGRWEGVCGRAGIQP